MNDYDRKNLLFLLEASEETIKDWYLKVDEDDRKYASSLLICYSWEVGDEVKDVEKASAYLSKFRIS